jgi:hypothetical protein
MFRAKVAKNKTQRTQRIQSFLCGLSFFLALFARTILFMIEINSSLVKQPVPLPEILQKLADLILTRFPQQPGQTFSREQIRQSVHLAQESLLPSYLAQDAVVYLLSFPLMSLTASGKFGKFVYVTSRGKTYLRRYVIPQDPKTVLQLTQRNYFKIAVAHYQQESAEIKSFWKEQTKSIIGKSGYNLYLGEVIKLLEQGIEPPLGFRG